MRIKSLLAAAPTLLATGALGVQSPAYAQTASAAAGDKPQLSEIIVTGSRIRRTDSETPSPVEVVTAEELHQSGYTSTQDVLHNLTANGQGTLSQSFSGAFASGASGVALRGLNVGATAVGSNDWKGVYHPYTAGLMASIPSVHMRNTVLHQIDGAMPRLNAIPAGCAFHPRCAYATPECSRAVPALETFDPTRTVACIRAREINS